MAIYFSHVYFTLPFELELRKCKLDTEIYIELLAPHSIGTCATTHLLNKIRARFISACDYKALFALYYGIKCQIGKYMLCTL